MWLIRLFFHHKVSHWSIIITQLYIFFRQCLHVRILFILMQKAWVCLESVPLGPIGYNRGMPKAKRGHHTVPDQFPDWVCCGYQECRHCQVHSWEVKNRCRGFNQLDIENKVVEQFQDLRAGDRVTLTSCICIFLRFQIKKTLFMYILFLRSLLVHLHYGSPLFWLGGLHVHLAKCCKICVTKVVFRARKLTTLCELMLLLSCFKQVFQKRWSRIVVDIIPWKAYANMSAYLRSRSEMLVECSHLMPKKSKQVWKIVHLVHLSWVQCSKMSCWWIHSRSNSNQLALLVVLV